MPDEETVEEKPKEETLQNMLGQQLINSPSFKGKVIIVEK
jgi:hypothetical protein